MPSRYYTYDSDHRRPGHFVDEANEFEPVSGELVEAPGDVAEELLHWDEKVAVNDVDGTVWHAPDLSGVSHLI